MNNNLDKIIIILVGIPHCGKTTFSNYVQYNYGFSVVSTDKIKKEIYNLNKNYDIEVLFKKQKEKLVELFEKKENIIADSNNSKVIYRQEIINIAKKYNYRTITIYILSDLSHIITRLKNDKKEHIIKNIKFYIDEIELDDVDYMIFNNKQYFKSIDKIMKGILYETKPIIKK